eukprot:73217_1
MVHWMMDQILKSLEKADAEQLLTWSLSLLPSLQDCRTVLWCNMCPFEPAKGTRLTSDLNETWWLNGSNLNVTPFLKTKQSKTKKGAYSQIKNSKHNIQSTKQTPIRQSKKSQNTT